jgi:hypothetical protein
MRIPFALPALAFLMASSAACHDAGETTARIEEGGWKSADIEEVHLAWLEMEDSYRFTVTAPTTGWVAVGFGGGPAMKDVDMVIGYFSDGEGHIRDDHGTSPVTHVADTDLDGSDDIIEYRISEADGSTEMTFVVPRSPGDDLDAELSPGAAVRVTVAYGDDDGFTGMHSAAHSAEVTL